MTARRALAPRTGPLLLVFAAAAVPTHPMDPGKPLALYRHERWGAEQGFPGGAVHAIVQGSDGYLWLGTEKGLVRFDGTEFRLVPSAPTRPTVATDVLGVAADPDGSLWLRLDSPTLLRYRDGRFDTVPFATHPREVAVTAMSRGENGRLLIYAQVSGLRAYREGCFETIAAGAIPKSIVMSLAETPDGSVWMGTRDAGLFRLLGESLSSVARGLPDRKVNSLLGFGERELWVGTDRGIVRWNGSELTSDGVPKALRSVPALALLRDRDANVWVGASTGLLRADAQGTTTLTDASLASGSVTALFEDREGSLWVGSGDGVERLRDTPFTTFSRSQGLPSDGSGAIHADDLGRIWFAPEPGGLYRLEGEQIRRIAVAGLGDDRVYSIARARDGVWIGSQRTGLTHLRLDGERLLARTYTRGDGLAQSSVYAVHESRDGSVWAGTLGDGLHRLRDGRLRSFTIADGLASNTVNALVDTHDGTLWAGTPAGLSSWSAGAWKTLGVADGLPSNNVISLLEDSTGVLWVGTAEGLAFLRSGRIEMPRAVPSLSEAVLGLAEGEAGWLWLATARSVMRARLEALLQGGIGEADVVSYGIADGLLGMGGVKRHRSVVADRRGRIWISTSRGLSFVVPRRATAALAPPLVHLESLTADDRPIGLRDAVRVPPGPQRVRIGYAGVSLSLPERVRFRYRLDGFDQGWSEPASTREAVYTNLPPGPYRFRVVASGGEGLWNGPEAILAFSIAPALWQTAGFQAAAVLLAAAGAWLLYAWRLGRTTWRLHAAFEERLAERIRIARELHDTLLQGFVSAAMQLHVAIEQVPDGSPARTLLGRVQQLMRQVIEEGRDTVSGLRSTAQDSADLAEAFSRVRDELAGDASAELRVIVEGTPRALHPSVRDELYRIGREALVNAFLHARASRVELELEYGRRAVRLLVRDDGAGIDPQVLEGGREGHYGLSGMRERAERIGGRLRLWSAPGAGTEVELVVRRSLAFAPPARAGLRGWLRRLRSRANARGAEAQRGAPDAPGRRAVR